MALENKLGLTSSAELAREEERISKKKALELFESGMLDKLDAGKFSSLKKVSAFQLFEFRTFYGYSFEFKHFVIGFLIKLLLYNTTFLQKIKSFYKNLMRGLINLKLTVNMILTTTVIG